MQPCSRELQAMNSLLNPTQQIPLQHLQINAHHQHQLFDDHNPTSSHDDFLDQILSNTTSLPSSSWSDPIKSPWDNQPKSDIYHNNAGFHYDEINLASKLRQNQINGGDSTTTAMKMMMMMMMQQQMILDGKSTVTSAAGGGIIDGSLQALYNGFDDGSLHHPQFQGGTMQTKSFGANSAAEMNQSTKGSGSTAEAAAVASEKPKQKVRARRGHATDPHSIAERLRRVRIAERMKSLQELVPSANKTDKASMLDEIIDYVKFLQLQVKVLSMSRLGSAAAVAPLVTDMPSEGGGDCVQTSIGRSLPQNFDGNQTSSANDSLTITEHQVAKLMEEDMGSAMQYLHGKGLCLMPISLATTISTSPSRSRNPVTNNLNANTGNGNHLLVQSSGGDGHSSPSVSVLTVQSTIMGSAGIDGAASISET